MNKYSILLVDDDLEILQVYARLLRLKGFEVVAVDNGKEALAIVEKEAIFLVISDIIMPKVSGMDLLIQIKEKKPEIEVIMLTAEGSIQGAVDAVKEGAYSYFVKPADIDELITSIKKVEELFMVRLENSNLKQYIEDISGKQKLVGNSDIANELRERAVIIGQTDSTVLITGESGTGKEVFANLVHQSSQRKNKPFVCVNCGALNENLIEAELFGAEKGSYTGADRLRKGYFETADGGSIFFDEIGELSLNMQVKLLRVLQEKSFHRVGGTEIIKSDFRLITATNRDLKEAVSKGEFREDLYYHINIIPVEVAPLRDRKADIRELAMVFLKEFASQTNRKNLEFGENVYGYLQKYHWPGNIRELRNIIERLVVLSRDEIISERDLPMEILTLGEGHIDESVFTSMGENIEDAGLKDMMRAYERELIIRKLHESNGNVSKAAEEMRIARNNLYRKINDYHIDYKEE